MIKKNTMLQAILSKFPITYQKISKINTGLVNETYLVHGVNDYFILQKVNPIFSPNTTNTLEKISNHLTKNGFITQKIVKTKNNKLIVVENGVWRLLTYIPGVVVEKIENPKMAYEAGKILGKFHYAIQNLKYDFKNPRELHHNSQKHFKLFLTAVRGGRQTTLNRGQEVYDRNEIKKLKNIILDLPSLYLPKKLRKTITHGDPKISNIIFNTSGKSLALIDFDDVGKKNNVLIELGDAMRSWCGGFEDDKSNYFNLSNFKEALRGYLEASKNFVTGKEWVLIPQAIKLITLELASRFLRDYFEDNYFVWDTNKYKSRKAHNLARAKGQVALYYDILKKEKNINDIIQKNL